MLRLRKFNICNTKVVTFISPILTLCKVLGHGDFSNHYTFFKTSITWTFSTSYFTSFSMIFFVNEFNHWYPWMNLKIVKTISVWLPGKWRITLAIPESLVYIFSPAHTINEIKPCWTGPTLKWTTMKLSILYIITIIFFSQTYLNITLKTYSHQHLTSPS